MSDETVPKAEFDKIQTRAQAFEAKVTDFEKRFAGIDPEAFKAFKEENEILRRDAVKGDPKKLEEFETSLKSDYDKRYGSKLTEAEQRAVSAENELKDLRVFERATSAASSKFKPEAMKMVKLLARQELDYKDGKIIVRGDDGKPKASSVNPRNDMDLPEWIDNLVNEHAYAALPTAKGGGKDAGEKGSNISGITPEQYLAMGQEKRAQIPREQRQQLFKQLAATAQNNR